MCLAANDFASNFISKQRVQYFKELVESLKCYKKHNCIILPFLNKLSDFHMRTFLLHHTVWLTNHFIIQFVRPEWGFGKKQKT